MKNIFLFGECMIELMHTSSMTMKQSFAGDVFNTAVYLKRLFPNTNVNLVTAVGQDHFSENMVKYFQDEYLSTDYVFRSETKIPGLYAIQLDQYGERSFTYWRDNSAARTVMDFINEDITKQLSKGDIFFFSGISLGVVRPESRDKFWQCIAELKAAGVKIAFDLNYRPKLWATKAEAQAQFLLAFEASDILLPGVDDFAAIFDTNDIHGVISFFEQYHYQELVVKNGEKNVYCLSSTGQDIVDVTPVKQVVDTTSAGDSFNGGYLGARMAGHSITKSVELANQVAGFVIQHPGAIVESSAFSSRFNSFL
ncbi:sugar kinase [Thalassotalea sp. PP2-459]|uniref:sugar kinase n=1 Tax=Thalassotalea sp. PP2-459 TaxID=1742724 RepID=UPI000942B2F9|nr:sugar kinase [Thalassotalea sp. PP2-459]OKY27888.1 ketodeoxygluconokinase [Thalassotalea sp. PP2-459]